MSSKTSYDSSYSALEFLEACNDVVAEEMEVKLAASPYVTVLADESTDIAVNKRLVIYAQLTNPSTMEASTEYVCNIQLGVGTGVAVAGAIFKEMEDRNVPPRKIMGLGSDGANVMVGTGTGVTGVMMRQNPHLVNVHCVAHRLALCSSKAAAEVPALAKYSSIITDIYYYFKYSANRQDKLKEIQIILDHPKLKVKEVHDVRWMSFFLALETIYKIMESLLTYLEGSNLKDPKAIGLMKKVHVIFNYIK